MNASIATLTIASLSPMTQSRKHDDPFLEKESHDAHDARTWRSKCHSEIRNGKPTVVIPSDALRQCLADAARYSKKQIPGQGKATWTAKFAAGIMIVESPALNIDPALLKPIAISAHADGKRGSGKRVTRRFPQIPEWEAECEIYVLDQIITEPVFREIVEIAGMFVGLGQFRPQNLGSNGRFKIKSLKWQDNRQLAA